MPLAAAPKVVRVRPDVTALDKTFDYGVPASWHSDGRAASLEIGSRVRVQLQGRRVGGWVVELDPEPDGDHELRPLQRFSGRGPDQRVIELATWAAHRWVGNAARFLRTASPQRNVMGRPPHRVARYDGPVDAGIAEAFEGAGAVLRLAPAQDRWPVVLAAAALGNPLLLVPTVDLAGTLARRLRRLGLQTALLPDDWATARAGAITIGTRAAAFGPVHELGAVVVFDEHDEIYREERTPTWHARDVAIERARRAGVPCVVVSPVPSLTARTALDEHAVDRTLEHGGWPTVQLVDRRDEPPGRMGLFSEHLGLALSAPGRTACVLNRVGRVRLLGCVACGELIACERCGAAVRQSTGNELDCPRCEAVRPPVCASCGGARLKNIVLGVGRAREELEALIGEPVGEVTASAADNADARVVIGTEALLRMRTHPDARFERVVFLDFDQHLAALGQRAEADAMSLLILAARQLGSRAAGGELIIQTRQPEHPVLDAVRRGDPRIWMDHHDERSALLRWPPTVAQAEISGTGARAFIEALGRPLGVDVLGPNEDSWLVRAPDVEQLASELGAVPRGEDRLRLAMF